jgi:hypothetical protein
MASFFAWAAAMQLNDPDPLRWFAIYAGASLVALLGSLARRQARRQRGLALALAGLALVWAAAIVPELWGRWSVRDLGATMSAARSEVEYGREFVGLLIIALYAGVAVWRGARGGAARARHGAAA